MRVPSRASCSGSAGGTCSSGIPRPPPGTRRRATRSPSRSARPPRSPEAVLGAFRRALRLHDRAPIPFDRARTLLALGAVQRRARRTGAARASLEEVRRTFEAVGAAAWARRAELEARRTGGRTAAPGLTTTERRVGRARRGGPLERRDRRQAVRHREDRGGARLADLRQARDPVPDRAHPLDLGERLRVGAPRGRGDPGRSVGVPPIHLPPAGPTVGPCRASRSRRTRRPLGGPSDPDGRSGPGRGPNHGRAGNARPLPRLPPPPRR